MFCAASALVISWQHINHLTFLVRDVYRFHLYFYVRMILHHLRISSPHEDGFTRLKACITVFAMTIALIELKQR